MRLTTKAINFDMAERLEKFIAKKMQRYEKLLPSTAEIEIRMTVVKPETNLNKETEIRLIGLGKDIFVKKTCDTFEQGIDECLDVINRQIEKEK